MLKSNLFLKSGVFQVLSIDRLGSGNKSSGTVEHLSIANHLIGLPRRASTNLMVSPSRSSILQVLHRYLLGILIGDATRPTLLVGYLSILERVRDFKPHVIYTNFGSTGLNALVLRLKRDLSVKLVTHFMDDWHRGRNSTGLLSKIIRMTLDKQTNRLLESSELRLVISDGMRVAFSERFSLNFHVVHNSVDKAIWLSEENKDSEYNSTLESAYKIRYVGTVLPDVQLDGLVLLAKSLSSINRSRLIQRRLKLEIHFSSEIQNITNLFEDWRDCVSFKQAPESDGDFVHILKTAAAIFLPMPLNDHKAKYIRYSLSAKLPAYLLSGTPIIYCGSKSIYQFELLRSRSGCYAIGDSDIDGTDEVSITKAIQADRSSFKKDRIDFVSEKFSYPIIENNFRNMLLGVL